MKTDLTDSLYSVYPDSSIGRAEHRECADVEFKSHSGCLGGSAEVARLIVTQEVVGSNPIPPISGHSGFTKT